MTRNNQNRLGISESNEEQIQEDVSPSELPLSFVVPTEIVDLPSKGRFYPDTHPLHGVESVEIRHMTTKDQDILNSKTLIKKGIALERTIQGLLVNQNIKLDDMFIGDKNAIILQSRISGISEAYNVNITCPSCGVSEEIAFNLSELSPYFGEESAQISNDGTFIVELPVSKVKVGVKLLTGKDEKELQQLEMNKRKHKLAETPLTDQFKKLIVSVNDEADKEVVGKFVDVMLNKDAMFLQKRYNEVSPNIDMKQSFACNSCEFSDKITVPLTTDFFWPKR